MISKPVDLLIIRHAIAMDREDFQRQVRMDSREMGARATARSLEASDELRPLTDEGISKMEKGAKALKKLVSCPNLLVSSPLTRAMQTAEILRETWKKLDIATSGHLRPGAAPNSLFDWLTQQPQVSILPDHSTPLIVLIGHEPHLSSFATWLMNGQRTSQVELKKGGACLLELPGGFSRPHARLKWLLTPRILRDLA